MTILEIGYIKLTVDIAYAFDFFSILEVKCIKTNEQNLETLNNKNKYKSEIIDQIGLELYDKIINSPEYKELFNINYKLFSVIDEAKKGGVDAIAIDNLNWFRFLAKKEIQRKYFNSEVSEQKFGYEK